MITRKTYNGSVLTLIHGDKQECGIYHVLVECKSNGSRGLQAWVASSKEEAISLSNQSDESYIAIEAKFFKAS